mmetsp:Transcript_123179/g.394537  ORF Transcript_123179/g.394537 Transcript_123179/m.394537 type:complete len:204 (+) Transcript_123179:444-1055(+)
MEIQDKNSSSWIRPSSWAPKAVQTRSTAWSLNVFASRTRKTLESCFLPKRPSPPSLTLRRTWSTLCMTRSSVPPSSSASDMVVFTANFASHSYSSPAGMMGASTSRPTMLVKRLPTMPALKYLCDFTSSQPLAPSRLSGTLFKICVMRFLPALSEYFPGKRSGSSRTETRTSCSVLLSSPNGNLPVTNSNSITPNDQMSTVVP